MTPDSKYDQLDPARIMTLLERFNNPKTSGNQRKWKRKNRVAIYVRKSRIEIGATHYSPKNQERQCREYAEREEWDIVAVIIDLDETGRHAGRDGFQELLGLVRTGQVDIVLVPYVDRSYRNGFSFPQFLDFLDKYKVQLVSVTELFDTRTFHGRLIAIVLGVIAEWPIWSASLRTRTSKHARARDGITNANYRLGYCNGLCSKCTDPNGEDYCLYFGGQDRAQYSGKRTIMVLHPIEKYAVLLIVHLYHQGWSDREVAHHLNHHAFVLPDGTTVRFRTKGRPAEDEDKGCPPGTFSRDSIRDIVKSLFYVGFVTYAESAPLSMRDDLENPERIPGKKHHPRRPDQIYKGLHEPLYPFELWQENQQIRLAKYHAPTTAQKPTRTYLLSDGLGFCWECFQHGLRRVGLRGSTNGSGQHSYRCATLHDKHKTRQPNQDDAVGLGTSNLVLAGETNFADLVASHARSSLPAAEMEHQAETLLSTLTLTPEIIEQVMAHYLSDDGMGEFILKKKNLFLEMERALTQHSLGLLDDNDLEEYRDYVTGALAQLTPAARPEAREILPLLGDFPAIWAQMTPLEKRTILRDIFAALYFDGQGKLVEARPHAPFASLL